ncbi:MAG: hypothetical protein P8K80_03630 [Phycisphaerales bacterium]|nr:hypothetical protein [Phycisphaerales bacterium]
MKRTRHTHHTSLLYGILGAALVGGLVGTAALAEGQAASSETTSEYQLASFEFEGGTISEYIKAINETIENANIVVDEQVLQFQVPPMQLTSIDVDSLLWLLENTTGDWNNEAYACDVSRHDSGGAILYRLSGHPQRGKVARGRSTQVQLPTPASMTTITSVAHTIELGMPSEDIISAMELALEVKGHPMGETTITYHAPTRLVILNGPSPSISTCTEVLDQVQVSAQSMTFKSDLDGDPEASVDRTKLVSTSD